VEVIQNELSQAGLNVKIEMMDTAGQLQYQLRPFPDNSGPFVALIMHGNQAGDAAFSVDQYMRTDGAQNGYGTPPFDRKIDAAGDLTGQQRQDAYAKLFAEEPNEVTQFAYIAHMNGVLAVSPRVDYQPNSATGDEMRLADMKFASTDRTDQQ
jgi:peptide/nickel transport system substrate-binding protein